ncbi:MAG: hypothetical protein Q7K44_04940 [Candidatus Liptonbacteria bacterium]|nr:hypothetical protein [Candidatus Liptonbacteria bacterium]
MTQEELLEMAGLDTGGEFSVVVNVAGEESPRREKINFKPEPGTDNVVQYALKKLAGITKKIERLEISGSGGGRFIKRFPENVHQHDFD